MKNIFIIIVILVFSSCGKTSYITYEIINETGHNLIIEGFSHRGANKDIIYSADKISLGGNSTFSVQREKGEDSDQRKFFSIPAIDSVRIIFDSTKLLLLSCTNGTENCHSIINPLDFSARITEEDYNNAISISTD